MLFSKINFEDILTKLLSFLFLICIENLQFCSSYLILDKSRNINFIPKKNAYLYLETICYKSVCNVKCTFDLNQLGKHIYSFHNGPSSIKYYKKSHYKWNLIHLQFKTSSKSSPVQRKKYIQVINLELCIMF